MIQFLFIIKFKNNKIKKILKKIFFLWKEKIFIWF
jgi:hypothetical protein